MSASATTNTCPLCDGTGWKTVGGEGDRRVTRCDCRIAERGPKLLAQARIPARYEHCELSNFDFEGPQASLGPARMAAYRFVENYPLENTGLLLMGPVGVGKTHLAVGILKALIADKGAAGLFYDYRELLKQVQNSYNASVQTTEMEVLRPVFEAEVLVLDELGAVRVTDWVWDTVSHILNTRYNDKRTTIITTNYPNLPPGGAAPRKSFSQAEQARAAVRDETLGDRIGERMRSRLHEMCKIIDMRGADYRQSFKSASFR